VKRQRHLSRAPIHEALIDIQFQPVGSVDLAPIAAELASGRNATVGEVWTTLLEFRVGPDADGKTIQSSGGPAGKRIDFPDEHQVVQLRANGFSFSQLQPYSTWEEMNASAIDTWLRFSAVMRPTTLSRVAVRYINKLALPLPLRSFDDYLEAAPQVPRELPQGLQSFLSRVVIPRGEDVAIVTQAFDGAPPPANAVSVLLDIDVFCLKDRPAADVGDLQSVLGRLRQFKNDVFFEQVTEATLEMYA
jgi:uncharacterized protein (TIGR04255 family)